MSTISFNLAKVVQSRRVLVILLMIILGIALTSDLVWMQTDQVIAPPGLRLMDEFWRLFICRCPPL